MFCWVNGINQDTISIRDRGFQYGDGFFETVLIKQGRLPLWDYHQARLTNTAKKLGIVFDYNTLELTIELAMTESIRQQHPMLLKLMFTRAQGGRAYNPEQCQNSTIVGMLKQYEPLPKAYYQQGVEVFTCRHRLATSPEFAGIKSLNSLDYVQASREFSEHAECYEGLLRHQQGYYIEGTRTNLWLVKNGQIFTSNLSDGGVAGVMRHYLLDNIPQWSNQQVIIQPINNEQLFNADEVFLSNAVVGAVPVKLIKGCQQYDDVTTGKRLNSLIQAHLFV